jgi:hypothetical protein
MTSGMMPPSRDALAQGRGSLACKGFCDVRTRASHDGGALTTAGSCALRRSASIARVSADGADNTVGALKIRVAGSPQVGHGCDDGAVPTLNRDSKTPQRRHR